jgi:hypothetical protein
MFCTPIRADLCRLTEDEPEKSMQTRIGDDSDIDAHVRHLSETTSQVDEHDTSQ